MSIKKRLMHHILVYISSQYLSQIIRFFTSIFLRRFLGPFNMGVWGILQIVMSYATYTQLGSMRTLFYKAPLLRGEGREQEAMEIQNIVFAFVYATTFFSAVAIAAYALLFRLSLPAVMFWGLLCSSLILLCERAFSYQVLLLRVHKDFDLLSRVVILEAASNLCLVLLIVSRYDIYGFFLISMALPFFTAWYIGSRRKFRLSFQWNGRKMGEYLKFGIPIFIRDSLDQILASIDKIMIGAFLGIQALGFFSIASMTRNYSDSMTKNFSHVLGPYFLEDYGRSGDARESSRYFIKPTHILSVLMACILGVIFFMCEPLIHLILPKFMDGLQALRIYLLSIFFASLSTQPNIYLVATCGQRPLILLSFVMIALNIALNFTLIRMGWGIAGVALATSVVMAANFIALYSMALRLSGGVRHVARQLAETLIAPFWAVVLVFMVQRFINMDEALMTAVMRSFLYLIGFAPLIYLLERRTGVLTLGYQILLEKMRRR